MAIAVPIIASWAAVAGGAAVAGMTVATYAATTVTGFLMTAGAALTTVGAVTTKKDLIKIGSFMQLGAGLGTALSAYNAAGAAGNAGAQISADAAMQSYGQLGQSAMPGFGTQAGAMLGQEAGALAGNALGSGMSAYGGSSPLLSSAFERASAGAAEIPKAGTSITAPQAPAAPEGSLADAAMQSYGSAGPQINPLQPMGAQDTLQRGASQLGQSEFMSLLKKAGKFVQDNPKVVEVGGNMLASAYGPEAEQMDFRKSIYNRQMANLNSPIKLGTIQGGR
jgi:DNA topoisomerase VI subunit B